MAQLPKTVRDFTAFIDGTGLAGRIKQATLPTITLSTEEHTAGGMAGTVDVFMGKADKMEIELEMDGMSDEFLQGIGDPDFPITMRGAISNGGRKESAIFETRGLFREAELGNLTRSDKGMTKLKSTLSYFKATIADRVVYEIDVLGGRLIVDGKDLLQEQRAALGI